MVRAKSLKPIFSSGAESPKPEISSFTAIPENVILPSDLSPLDGGKGPKSSER
jgi:hypothetical protein